MLNVFDLHSRELFEGIQGNILKAHGRHHTANLFIRCNQGEQTSAKSWLKSLVDEDGIVQSAYAQLRSNVLWKEKCVDAGLFACIHISAVGYDYLFGDNAKLRFNDESFQKGMKKALINDPLIEKWEVGFGIDNHFMLLLAHTDRNELLKSVETITKAIPSFASITTLENGEALFNMEESGIEHFGYVDGVSQPLFFDDEWNKYLLDNNILNPSDIQFDPRAEKELVLTQDPFFPDSTNALGSYFVFCKLEQNVRGFKQAELALADELGLRGEDRERAGAMLVGRFEDGTPIELSKEEGIIHNAVINNFDYDLTDGSKCPFHGHIRKSNPRSSMSTENGNGMEEAKKHIMARRGIPFGTRTDNPNDGHLYNKPEGNVGLLFMSYQASISNQFEFIQNQWVNEPSFPHSEDGIDPIIGQAARKDKGIFASKWGDSSTLKRAGFEQFVHMKGGDYFFAPSMSFLKNIDTI